MPIEPKTGRIYKHSWWQDSCGRVGSYHAKIAPEADLIFVPICQFCAHSKAYLHPLKGKILSQGD